MKLYAKNGYLNIEGLLSQSLIFNFFIGGRGTGKTFGILKYIHYHHLKVFLVRRQQTQVDIISKPEFNPFKPIDHTIEVKSGSKYHSVFMKDGEIIGYCAALSTFSKIRGFDASDIDIIFYDEFIPELHERNIRNEAEALFNAYETVNRNRELLNLPPVRLICAANSNRLDNPVLLGFDLLRRIEKMYRDGRELYIDRQRSIMVALLQDSPISQRKSETVLYKALKKNRKFTDMALENQFSFSDELIESKDMSNYRIIFKIDKIGFYTSRQSSSDFYIRYTKEDCKKAYPDTADGIRKMRLDYPFLAIWDAKGYITYENLDLYTRFRELLT